MRLQYNLIFFLLFVVFPVDVFFQLVSLKFICHQRKINEILINIWINGWFIWFIHGSYSSGLFPIFSHWTLNRESERIQFFPLCFVLNIWTIIKFLNFQQRPHKFISHRIRNILKYLKIVQFKASDLCASTYACRIFLFVTCSYNLQR